MQDENTDRSQTARREKRWFRRRWAWVLWGLLSLILFVSLIGLWAWTQRYALMEDYIIDAFAEAGFDADLDISSVTKTQASIQDIRLQRDGQDILRVETLRAEYIWPDIRDGKFKRLHVEGATGRLDLGSDWLPSDKWIGDLLPKPGGSSDNAASSFPENGVSLTESTLLLTSPLGEAKLFIDAEIPAADTFESEITLAPSDLSYGGYAAKGAGFATLQKTGDDLRVIGRTQTAALSNPKLDLIDADLNIDGTFNLDAMTYVGGLSLDGDGLSSELVATGPARLAWDGQISLQDDIDAAGTWSVDIQMARSPRQARAEELAETLSLFPALSVVPVTEHYAPDIRETVLDFIVGSDVNGQGRLTFGPEGFSINPVGVVSIESPRNRLFLESRSDEDFYRFEKGKSMISAQMNAQFKTPVALKLTDIQLEAMSANGVKIGGIQSFAANLTTGTDWHTRDESGRPVRLGPLNAAVSYGTGREPRRLSVKTALDYDGDLPGGYVEGLNLEGKLDVRLYDGRQVLDFTPKPDSLVTLDMLETPTSWRGHDISFRLDPTESLLARTPKSTVLAATLKASDFTLRQDAAAKLKSQCLDLQSAEMKLAGTLLPDKTQTWSVKFEDAKYSSETLPGPGTKALAAQASLTAKLQLGQDPQISLESSSISARTPQVELNDIELSLKGTPDSYAVDHKGGTIVIIGSDFAEAARTAGFSSFPAEGTVKFQDGAYFGQATLQVANADNAKVDVEYTYENGAGRADIDIPSILFTPKGLQPQTLIPAFRGKIARVNGEVRAKVNITFKDGMLTGSGGQVQIIDMAVGTAPGPIEGLNTTLNFASLFPLETDGLQQLTMDNFNPGLPLEDGVMAFNLVPEGVEVAAADWPIGNGSFSLDPFTWVYTAEENRVIMRVKDIALGDFLNDLGNKKIQATGNVVGSFPIVVRGVEVLIENGNVSVPDGGLIKYDPGPNAREYTEEEAIQILRERRSSEYAALAQDALREFRYRELSASLDGPINGDVEIGLVFDGSNARVLNRQPFRFDISVKGELFNIARSFNSNAQVKSEILRQNGKLPEGAIIGE